MAQTQKGSISVAIYQGSAENGNVHANLDKMKEQIKAAKKLGADVIVFPELFTTGYFLSRELMRELAEKKNGRFFSELSACARENDIGVLYGYPELSEDLVYNSAQFLDKSGNSLENYRKAHLWTLEDNSIEFMFTPGDKLSSVFEFCGVKIGLCICYDVEFSETVRCLALRGADVVLCPTAVADYERFAEEAKFTNTSVLATRAFDNGIYLAFVNYSGQGFAGGSRCYGPKAERLVACGGTEDEGIFLTEFRKVQQKSAFLLKRRPELYGDIVK